MYSATMKTGILQNSAVGEKQFFHMVLHVKYILV